MIFVKSITAIVAALPVVSGQNMLRSRVLTDSNAECPTESVANFGCTLVNLKTGESFAPLPSFFQVDASATYSIECKASSQLEDPNFQFKWADQDKMEKKSPFWINGNDVNGVNPVDELTVCDQEFKLYAELRNGFDDCVWDVFHLTPKCQECGCPDYAVPKNECPTKFDECECKPGFVPKGEVCVCPEGTELDGDECVPCSCPDNSIPADGITCPRSSDDCICEEGYEKDADGECVPCSCPENSEPAEEVTCPSTPDDCVCVEGYEKDGDDCVPETCPSKNLICQDRVGDMKYLTYRKNDGKCEAKCEDMSKSLELIAKDGFTCDPCVPSSCPSDNICEQKDGKTKYNLYRTKSDGNCEIKCEEPKNFPDKFKDGFSCDPCAQQEPGDDVCDTCGKPINMTMIYTGNDNNDNNQQEGKTSVSGSVGGAESVYIIASDSSTSTSGKWFEGTVAIGGAFAVDSMGDKFASNTWFQIKASQNGPLLQLVQMHTSCSAPIGKNDQFGSLLLVEYKSESGLCFSTLA